MRNVYEPVPFFNELDRVFNAAFPAASRLANGHARASASAVRFDEDENAYTLSADLPGVTRENVDLDVENGVLTVTARRAFKGDNAEARTVFHRTIKLPEGADTDKATARLDNGVLELTFPKEESRKPRKLTIE